MYFLYENVPRFDCYVVYVFAPEECYTKLVEPRSIQIKQRSVLVSNEALGFTSIKRCLSDSALCKIWLVCQLWLSLLFKPTTFFVSWNMDENKVVEF